MSWTPPKLLCRGSHTADSPCAGDKAAPHQPLQGLRQPTWVLYITEEALDQTQMPVKRGRRKEKEPEQQSSTNLLSVLLNVTFGASKILPLLSFNRMKKRNLKLGGKVQVMFLLATCKAKGFFQKITKIVPV